MLGDLDIIEAMGRTVFDSFGNPAIEAEVILENGAHGKAIISLQANQDPETEENFINEWLSEVILFENAADQGEIDRMLLKECETKAGSETKSAGVLALSMAVARAAGAGLGLPLYRYLGGTSAPVIPTPMMSMICGGDSSAGIDFKDIMIVPDCTKSYQEGLQMGVEIYQTLKKLLSFNGFNTTTGSGGGFVADLKNTEEALHYIKDAIELAGYEPGRDAAIAISADADRLYKKEDGAYRFVKESKNNGLLIHRSQKDMVDYYLRLADGFPITSIINGLSMDDIEGRRLLVGMLGHRVLMVFQDNVEANADMIDMKQAGTVSDALNMIENAKQAGHKVMIVNDFIDTEESFTADLAAAVRADYVKCGAPCRGECTAKYNELLRIEEFYYNRRQSVG